MDLKKYRQSTKCRLLLLLCLLPVLFLLFVLISDTSDPDSFIVRGNANIRRELYSKSQRPKDIDITATYTDASGVIRVHTIKLKELSASWSLEDSDHMNSQSQIDNLGNEGLIQKNERISREDKLPSTNEQLPVHPIKLQRKKLREKRRELRTAALIDQTFSNQEELEEEAIERSKNFETTTKKTYSIWRSEYLNPNPDTTVKLMKHQIIMAKVYASIVQSRQDKDIYDSLMNQIKDSQHAIGKATYDAELQPSAMENAKAMGHILSYCKDNFFVSDVVARKLRAMVMYVDESVHNHKKRSTFLLQLAAKTVPKPLHCLHLQLTTDYYYMEYDKNLALTDSGKIEDPTLYHYAIFSDNVLSTSVVVNSTFKNAKEPEKHVFHVVTDGLNIAAMKMWFFAHHPPGATVNVENVDDFKWLNSSYCSVLRQLESSRVKEYYFKMNNPSSLSAGNENLKYRNPKYLSMLNHLRFYMPEIYPKLDKILFLDDDVVVQKDLTPLWDIDMKGMVNGAVETCKESFHRFETYLNFSNPKISENFDPRACGWAFGMNLFDLKEWRKRNMTGIYHYWQDLNDDRQLWKLGSLPPGLITFYNLTYPLDRDWHVLGLGYDPSIETSKIESAGVIHYNGNYKPWLDLAYSKYKNYWSKFVMDDNPHLKLCNYNRT